VFNRRGGGHVAIVHHVRRDGTVIYLNPRLVGRRGNSGHTVASR
jgi:hypothetical protein